MSQFDNNDHPRDFYVVKDERSNDVKYDPEHRNEAEYREETSAEYAPNPGLLGGRQEVEFTSDKARDADGEEEAVGGRGIGSFAVALAIVSLFFLPIIFAAAGLVLGFMSVNRGHKALGYTAIAISAFTIIMAVFFAPFVT